jgi:hypothetical protein
MSLLTIIERAMVLCGQSAPTTVINNPSPTVTQFRVLSEEEGDELARYHDWRALKVSASLTGDGTSTEFDLPIDFHRFMPGDKFWMDDTPTRPLLKVSDDEMARAKANDTDPIYPYWRLFGDQIEFFPAPETGQVIRTEYRTNYWILSSDESERRLTWAADTDFTPLPERVIVLGVRWRWRKMQGLDYAEDQRTWQIERDRECYADNPRQTLHVRKPMTHDGLLRGAYGDTPGIVP